MSDEFVFTEQNDEFDWKETAKGDPGVTFTPAVSEQGIISWTNDGGLPNPQPRDIRGPKGDSLDLPQGGEAGQVLKKYSDTDYDVIWADEAGGSGKQSDWDETNPADPAFIKHKPTIPDAQIQSDWNQTTTTAKDFIKNKPTVPAVDVTLSNTGEAADAKKTGDEISDLKNTLTQLETDTFGDINLTGTNNTGSTITTGTFFYNNGSLVKAKTDIQNGSAITIGTNAETVTAGGLNDLNRRMVPSGTSIYLVGQMAYNTKFAYFLLPSKAPNSITISSFSVMNVGNYSVKEYTLFDCMIAIELNSAIESTYRFAPARLICTLNY